jgi:5'-nucleotidase / UDP-sugar diphosphatase
LIVALSHSGTNVDPVRSEDEMLARAVPQIDVIVSGHTHTTLRRPIVVGRTFVVSAGCFGASLGILQLDLAGAAGTGAGLVSYEVKPIRDDLPEDPLLAVLIRTDQQLVDTKVLAPFKLAFDQVMARSDFSLEPLASLYVEPLHESGLGNLITDAYREAVRAVEAESSERSEYVHIALDPIGMIRDSITQGQITFGDAFRVLSLGLGSDRGFGAALTAFYWTGAEVKQALELNTTLALAKADWFQQVSGLKLTYDMKRPPFHRISSLVILEPTGVYRPVEPTRLYRVVVNDGFAQALPLIAAKSSGQVALVPRNAAGRPVAGLNALIVTGPPADGHSGPQLKEWEALARYLSRLPDDNGDGVPDVPRRYRASEGRITAQP